MFKIDPDPVFDAKVKIHVPGRAAPSEFTGTFRFKSPEELTQYFKDVAEKKQSDVDTLLDIMTGWKDIDAEFGKESIEKLLGKWHGAAQSFYDAFVGELTGARQKN